MRVLLAVAAVLAVLLLGDRLADVWAEGRVATALRESGTLGAEPEVTIRGLPFLSQAVAGRYRDVTVDAAGVEPADRPRVERLRADLTGARLPLAGVVGETPTRLPVDRVEAEALLTFGDLERYAAPDAAETLRLSAVPGGADDAVRVETVVRVLGRDVEVRTDSRLRVEGDELVVTAGRLELGDSEGGAAEAVLNRVTGDDLDLRVPLDGLPAGLTVSEVRVTPQGLVALASGSDVVLDLTAGVTGSAGATGG